MKTYMIQDANQLKHFNCLELWKEKVKSLSPEQIRKEFGFSLKVARELLL